MREHNLPVEKGRSPMRNRLILSILVFALAVSPAFAKGKPTNAGGGNKQEHGQSGEHGKGGGGDHDRDDDRDHGKGKHDRNDHDRDHGRASGERPAGWDKGKKVGWGDCDVPPGQEKKAGVPCRSTSRKHHAKSTHVNSAPTTTTTSRPTRNPRTTTTRPAPTTSSTASRPTTTTKPTTTTTSRPTRPARTTDGTDRLETVKKR